MSDGKQPYGPIETSLLNKPSAVARGRAWSTTFRGHRCPGTKGGWWYSSLLTKPAAISASMALTPSLSILGSALGFTPYTRAMVLYMLCYIVYSWPPGEEYLL